MPQTPLSHVNLRALQDRAPNAFIRDALDDDTIDSLIGSLVRYTVAAGQLHDPRRLQVGVGCPLRGVSAGGGAGARARPHGHRDHRPQRRRIGDWDAFGVKAANVAVLGTLGFADGTVPDGFAVPFYFYDEFMKANELDAMVTTMLADADFQASYDTQEKGTQEAAQGDQERHHAGVDDHGAGGDARGVPGGDLAALPLEHQQRRPAGV